MGQRSPSCIYGLTDPRYDDEIRYIGKAMSATPNSRYRAHLNEASSPKPASSHKLKWMRKLSTMGLTPGVITLECGDWTLEERNAAEVHWIAYGLGAEWRLTNATLGGDGGRIEMSIEQRTQWIARKRASAFAVREVLVANARSMWQDEAYREKQKLNPRSTGKVSSPEKRAQLSESNRRTKQLKWPPSINVCAWCGEQFTVPYRKRHQVCCSRSHHALLHNARRRQEKLVPDGVQVPRSMVQ